ncbi:unnamed protein product [Microthlaspi erraticum]|uniref:Uncharacterized protein n=1 Tax=Microthlaspi erraticum TaxID=1685480 RepID=A0A6D2I106_9BRAS|nr:unnamed protein product [Microthlaspi erraticum]
MYNVCLLTLAFLLLSGLSITTLARVQYQSPKSELGEWIWDQKVIKDIKIGADPSCSLIGPGRRPPNRPGSPKRCT